MLESLWNLVTGLTSSIWALFATLATFAWDTLFWLHLEAPRLEGLLVGVLLAWLFTRRDSHPLLRVASAPLKLVLDILDLAWDQVDEVVKDLWDTAKGWTLSSLGWVSGKLRGSYGAVMGKLRSTKEKLEEDEGQE
jgi:hypothetical protein